MNYKPSSKPDEYQKYLNWTTAIGLQAVDGLTPSKYLLKLAQEHIEGKRTSAEIEELVNGYYNSLSDKEKREKKRQNEADIVANRIEQVLETGSFILMSNSLKDIHKKLFAGWKEYAPGKYRTYDIVKSEWALDGDTVQYGHFENLDESIIEIIKSEKNFKYTELSVEKKIKHVADFTSELWAQHPFLEGNTRTTAILIILYLRSIGFDVDNVLFENNSLYFRNALVRANYSNGVTNINKEDKYLIKFYENLLTGKKNVLKNRHTHVFWDS